MALTILANFSQILQSEISLAELTVLTNFSQNGRFLAIFAIFVTACISGHKRRKNVGNSDF